MPMLMLAWEAFRASKVFQWLTLAAVAAIAFFGMRAQQRAEGRSEVNAQNAQRLLEISQERAAVEMAVTNGADDPDDQLCARWSKPGN